MEVLGNPNERCAIIKNLKLGTKLHKTVKPSYICYQPRQQQKAMNKYQSHLPIRTVSECLPCLSVTISSGLEKLDFSTAGFICFSSSSMVSASQERVMGVPK